MEAIGGLLDRFKTLEAPERVVRMATIEAVREIIGIEIYSNSIKIDNNSILYISTASVIKTEIFENKDNLISRINNILKQDRIKDIR